MKSAIAVCTVLCVFYGTSCAAIENELRNRGNDFADIFTVKAGYGPGFHSGVSLFGLLKVFSGASTTHRAGFEGRNFVRDDYAVIGSPIYNIFVPIVSIIRGDYRRYGNEPLGIFSCFATLFSTGDEKIRRNPEKWMKIWDSYLEFSTADYELWIYGWGRYLGLN